jgi:type IV secretory pathway VirB6-like protein
LLSSCQDGDDCILADDFGQYESSSKTNVYALNTKFIDSSSLSSATTTDSTMASGTGASSTISNLIPGLTEKRAYQSAWTKILNKDTTVSSTKSKQNNGFVVSKNTSVRIKLIEGSAILNSVQESIKLKVDKSQQTSGFGSIATTQSKFQPGSNVSISMTGKVKSVDDFDFNISSLVAFQIQPDSSAALGVEDYKDPEKWICNIGSKQFFSSPKKTDGSYGCNFITGENCNPVPDKDYFNNANYRLFGAGYIDLGNNNVAGRSENLRYELFDANSGFTVCTSNYANKEYINQYEYRGWSDSDYKGINALTGTYFKRGGASCENVATDYNMQTVGQNAGGLVKYSIVSGIDRADWKVVKTTDGVSNDYIVDAKRPNAINLDRFGDKAAGKMEICSHPGFTVKAGSNGKKVRKIILFKSLSNDPQAHKGFHWNRYMVERNARIGAWKYYIPACQSSPSKYVNKKTFRVSMRHMASFLGQANVANAIMRAVSSGHWIGSEVDDLRKGPIDNSDWIGTEDDDSDIVLDSDDLDLPEYIDYTKFYKESSAKKTSAVFNDLCADDAGGNDKYCGGFCQLSMLFKEYKIFNGTDKYRSNTVAAEGDVIGLQDNVTDDRLTKIATYGTNRCGYQLEMANIALFKDGVALPTFYSYNEDYYLGKLPDVQRLPYKGYVKPECRVSIGGEEYVDVDMSNGSSWTVMPKLLSDGDVVKFSTTPVIDNEVRQAELQAPLHYQSTTTISDPYKKDMYGNGGDTGNFQGTYRWDNSTIGTDGKLSNYGWCYERSPCKFSSRGCSSYDYNASDDAVEREQTLSEKSADESAVSNCYANLAVESSSGLYYSDVTLYKQFISSYVGFNSSGSLYTSADSSKWVANQAGYVKTDNDKKIDIMCNTSGTLTCTGSCATCVINKYNLFNNYITQAQTKCSNVKASSSTTITSGGLGVWRKLMAAKDGIFTFHTFAYDNVSSGGLSSNYYNDLQCGAFDSVVANSKRITSEFHPKSWESGMPIDNFAGSESKKRSHFLYHNKVVSGCGGNNGNYNYISRYDAKDEGTDGLLGKSNSYNATNNADKNYWHNDATRDNLDDLADFFSFDGDKSYDAVTSTKLKAIYCNSSLSWMPTDSQYIAHPINEQGYFFDKNQRNPSVSSHNLYCHPNKTRECGIALGFRVFDGSLHRCLNGYKKKCSDDRYLGNVNLCGIYPPVSVAELASDKTKYTRNLGLCVMKITTKQSDSKSTESSATTTTTTTTNLMSYYSKSKAAANKSVSTYSATDLGFKSAIGSANFDIYNTTDRSQNIAIDKDSTTDVNLELVDISNCGVCLKTSVVANGSVSMSDIKTNEKNSNGKQYGDMTSCAKDSYTWTTTYSTKARDVVTKAHYDGSKKYSTILDGVHTVSYLFLPVSTKLECSDSQLDKYFFTTPSDKKTDLEDPTARETKPYKSMYSIFSSLGGTLKTTKINPDYDYSGRLTANTGFLTIPYGSKTTGPARISAYIAGDGREIGGDVTQMPYKYRCLLLNTDRDNGNKQAYIIDDLAITATDKNSCDNLYKGTTDQRIYKWMMALSESTDSGCYSLKAIGGDWTKVYWGKNVKTKESCYVQINQTNNCKGGGCDMWTEYTVDANSIYPRCVTYSLADAANTSKWVVADNSSYLTTYQECYNKDGCNGGGGSDVNSCARFLDSAADASSQTYNWRLPACFIYKSSDGYASGKRDYSVTKQACFKKDGCFGGIGPASQCAKWVTKLSDQSDSKYQWDPPYAGLKRIKEGSYINVKFSNEVESYNGKGLYFYIQPFSNDGKPDPDQEPVKKFPTKKDFQNAINGKSDVSSRVFSFALSRVSDEAYITPPVSGILWTIIFDEKPVGSLANAGETDGKYISFADSENKDPFSTEYENMIVAADGSNVIGYNSGGYVIQARKPVSSSAVDVVNSIMGSGTKSSSLDASSDATTYSDVKAINGSGKDATFQVIAKSGDPYTITIAKGGSGYVVGDKLKISGDDLGGGDLLNSAYITVATIDLLGAILNISYSGTAKPSDFVGSIGGAVNTSMNWAASSIFENLMDVMYGPVDSANPTCKTYYNDATGSGGTFSGVDSITLDNGGIAGDDKSVCAVTSIGGQQKAIRPMSITLEKTPTDNKVGYSSGKYRYICKNVTLKQSGRVCKYKVKVKSKTSIENECGRDGNSKLGLQEIHNYNPTSILRMTKIDMPDSKNLITEKTPLFTPKINCIQGAGGCTGEDYSGGSKCALLEVAQSSVWNTYCSVHSVGTVYDASLDLAKVSPAFFALRFLSDQKLYPEQDPTRISVIDPDLFPNKTPFKTISIDGGKSREVYNIPYNKVTFKRPTMVTRKNMAGSGFAAFFGEVYTKRNGFGKDETICRARTLPPKKTMRYGGVSYGYIDNYDRNVEYSLLGICDKSWYAVWCDEYFVPPNSNIINGIDSDPPRETAFTMYETESLPPFKETEVYLQAYNTSKIYKDLYIKNKYIISDDNSNNDFDHSCDGFWSNLFRIGSWSGDDIKQFESVGDFSYASLYYPKDTLMNNEKTSNLSLCYQPRDLKLAIGNVGDFICVDQDSAPKTTDSFWGDVKNKGKTVSSDPDGPIRSYITRKYSDLTTLEKTQIHPLSRNADDTPILDKDGNVKIKNSACQFPDYSNCDDLKWMQGDVNRYRNDIRDFPIRKYSNTPYTTDFEIITMVDTSINEKADCTSDDIPILANSNLSCVSAKDKNVTLQAPENLILCDYEGPLEIVDNLKVEYAKTNHGNINPLWCSDGDNYYSDGTATTSSVSCPDLRDDVDARMFKFSEFKCGLMKCDNNYENCTQPKTCTVAAIQAGTCDPFQDAISVVTTTIKSGAPEKYGKCVDLDGGVLKKCYIYQLKPSIAAKNLTKCLYANVSDSNCWSPKMIQNFDAKNDLRIITTGGVKTYYAINKGISDTEAAKCRSSSGVTAKAVNLGGSSVDCWIKSDEFYSTDFKLVHKTIYNTNDYANKGALESPKPFKEFTNCSYLEDSTVECTMVDRIFKYENDTVKSAGPDKPTKIIAEAKYFSAIGNEDVTGMNTRVDLLNGYGDCTDLKVKVVNKVVDCGIIGDDLGYICRTENGDLQRFSSTDYTNGYKILSNCTVYASCEDPSYTTSGRDKAYSNSSSSTTSGTNVNTNSSTGSSYKLCIFNKRDLTGGMIYKIFNAIVGSIAYQSLFYTAMMLWLMSYGYKMFTGETQFKHDVILKDFTRLTIVLLLTSPTGWDNYEKIVINMAIKLQSGFSDLAISAITGGESNVTVAQIMSPLNEMLTMIFNTAFWLKILAAVFSLPYLLGVVMAMMMIGMVFNIISKMFNLITQYLSSIVMLGLYLSIGPLVAIGYLFNRYESHFKEWIKLVTGCIIEQFFLILSLSLLSQIVMYLIKPLILRTICYKPVFSIPVGDIISGVTFGLISGVDWDMPLISFWKYESSSRTANIIQTLKASSVDSVEVSGSPQFGLIIIMMIIPSAVDKISTIMEDFSKSIDGGKSDNFIGSTMKSAFNTAGNFVGKVGGGVLSYAAGKADKLFGTDKVSRAVNGATGIVGAVWKNSGNAIDAMKSMNVEGGMSAIGGMVEKKLVGVAENFKATGDKKYKEQVDYANQLKAKTDAAKKENSSFSDRHGKQFKDEVKAANQERAKLGQSQLGENEINQMKKDFQERAKAAYANTAKQKALEAILGNKTLGNDIEQKLNASKFGRFVNRAGNLLGKAGNSMMDEGMNGDRSFLDQVEKDSGVKFKSKGELAENIRKAIKGGEDFTMNEDQAKNYIDGYAKMSQGDKSKAMSNFNKSIDGLKKRIDETQEELTNDYTDKLESSMEKNLKKK